MIQITPQMRVVVAVEPADFRKGIDGLARLCKEALGHDPFGGWVFVFRNRRATAVKVLVYDGQGFWLCHKKLEPEGTPILGFTEVGRLAHNRHIGVAEARRMVRISRKSSPRRRVMSGQGRPIVPPRAQRERKSFGSTNSGRS